MRRTLLAVAILAVAACEKTEPPPPPSPELARTAPPDAATPPPAWTIAFQSDYGLCRPDDPTPCHRSWVATADGKLTVTAYPNTVGKPPAVNVVQMLPANRDALRALVQRPDFIGSMVRGWKCQGPAPSYDATMSLSFSDPLTKLEARQYVERCDRDAGGDVTLTQILALLRHG